jgi:hypothetical protein
MAGYFALLDIRRINKKKGSPDGSEKGKESLLEAPVGPIHFQFQPEDKTGLPLKT